MRSIRKNRSRHAVRSGPIWPGAPPMSKASSVESRIAQAISSADPSLEETKREDEVLGMPGKSDRRTKTIVSVTSVVGLLVVWELVARFAIHDVAILPA